MEVKTDEFENTINWAVEEEKIRLTRGQGVSSFYLIFFSFVILVTFLIILYYSNNKKERSALEMMQNSEYIYDEYSNNETENIEEIVEE